MAGMDFRPVYIHGAARRGVDAWPAADPGDGDFVAFGEGMTIPEQIEQLVQDHGSRPLLLFAHSIGAVPAVLAANRLQIAGMVLVEPALYDVVRGEETIERHIAIVTEARARSAAGDLRGFWAILRPLMFGGPFDPAAWHEERSVAERWAHTNLPWGHGVRREMLDGIRTLIVTGGWNDEYETIAEALASRGAEHRVLVGAQHRPQDLPGFRDIVAGFIRALGSTAVPKN